MRKRFKKQVEQAAELRTLFVLVVLLALRAWRVIPTMRPHQILLPATISQIVVFIIAAFNPGQFITIIAIGNILIVGIAIFPSTFIKSEASAHWIRQS